MLILHLNENEAMVVMNALAERPLREVGALYGKLDAQIREQMQKAQPVGTGNDPSGR